MAVSNPDAEPRRLHLRLGLLNGLLIGLALALGVWASDAVFLAASHVRWLVYPSILLGSLALVLLGGLAGWLAAWTGRGWLGMLIWLAAGGLMMLVIGHVPYEGRTLTVWLADPRSWGLSLYPFDEVAGTGVALASFFTLLLFGVLGLLQPYRLEGIEGETDDRGRPRGAGWFLLLLPLPLVVAVGLVNDNVVSKPLRVAPQLVHEAIRTGRTYPGNLFELSLEKGVNYNAISAVRDQMTDEYTLSIGEIDLGTTDTVFVIADFDNGAWIACRIVADQLSFCYDASEPYLQGLPALIMTGQTPEDCPRCSFTASEEQRAWLQARRELFGGSPSVTRLAQWGRYVLVQAESPDGEYAIECRFQGLSVVRLDTCEEVRARDPVAEPTPLADQPAIKVARLDSTMWDPTDRLGPPPMSDPPTQVELGHYAYYLSCMVCHGDEGQGLEAWRTVLPEEDRDCWQSRCHAANHPPGGFRYPKYAPPIMGPGTLARFQTGAELYDYLRTQMPWQAPGILPGEEYQQITAFLAHAHGADPGQEPLTPQRAATLNLHPSPGEPSP